MNRKMTSFLILRLSWLYNKNIQVALIKLVFAYQPETWIITRSMIKETLQDCIYFFNVEEMVLYGEVLTLTPFPEHTVPALLLEHVLKLKEATGRHLCSKHII